MEFSNITLSELETKKVIDVDGVRAGKITDVRFDEDGSTWFVLGGGFVKHTLEKLHIRPKIDLLVPAEWIARVEEHEIVLTQSVFQLEATCQECWIREKDRFVAEATSAHDGAPALRLRPPPVL